MDSFGTRLRALRKAKGLRQEDVAKDLYIHRSAYTKYELDNAEPPMDTLCKLSQLFGVTINYLLGLE